MFLDADCAFSRRRLVQKNLISYSTHIQYSAHKTNTVDNPRTSKHTSKTSHIHLDIETSETHVGVEYRPDRFDSRPMTDPLNPKHTELYVNHVQGCTDNEF